MILKIVAKTEERDFFMYDGVEKISVSPSLPRNNEVKTSVADDVHFFFNEPECSCGPEECCPKCLSCKRVIARTKDDKEFSFIFDTVLYVLNDNGKTVESITANI